MIGEELVVDGFPAAKTFLDAVPEADAILAEFPAQADFLAMVERQEIDQTGLQILDQRADLFDAVEGVLERGGARIAAGAGGEIGVAIEARAAGHADVPGARVELAIGALIFGAMKHGVAQRALHVGQEAFAIGESEMARQGSRLCL